MARPLGFDKTEALLAIERQFRKTGYAGTSLDDIAEVTGLGRGSLYAAFGDKHSLFMQALDGYCDRGEASVIAALSGPDDGALDRLHGYLHSAVETIFTDDDRLGCMAGKFALELSKQDPEVATRIQDDFTRLQQALAECVEAAQRNGDLDPTANARDIGCLIHTTARGIDVLANGGRSRDELEAAADLAFSLLPLTPAGRSRSRG